MSIETKPISPQLQQLIEELKNSVLNTRAIYERFVEAARNENFTDQDIDMLIRHHLKGIIPDRTLRHYRQQFLSIPEKRQIAGIDHKKDMEESSDSNKKVNITTAYDIKEAETEEDYKPSSSMEEFRKEHGTIIEQTVELEPDIIYDKQFVDRLVKENAELVKQFSFDYDVEVKDQVLPFRVTVYPPEKYGHVRLRKEKAK